MEVRVLSRAQSTILIEDRDAIKASLLLFALSLNHMKRIWLWALAVMFLPQIAGATPPMLSPFFWVPSNEEFFTLLLLVLPGLLFQAGWMTIVIFLVSAIFVGISFDSTFSNSFSMAFGWGSAVATFTALLSRTVFRFSFGRRIQEFHARSGRMQPLAFIAIYLLILIPFSDYTVLRYLGSQVFGVSHTWKHDVLDAFFWVYGWVLAATFLVILYRHAYRAPHKEIRIRRIDKILILGIAVAFMLFVTLLALISLLF